MTTSFGEQQTLAGNGSFSPKRYPRKAGVPPDSMICLVMMVFNFGADKLMGLSWSWIEAVMVFATTILLSKLDFFNDDLHLSSR